MKRRLAYLVLILVLCFAFAFSGCTQATTQATTAATQATTATTKPAETTKASNLTAPGTFPIVKDKVTLTIFKVVNGEKENLDTNPFTVFYAAKTNVDFKWINSPADRFKEKMNLMFSSGDMPDIIATGNNGATLISRLEESSLAEEGVIIPINDLLKTQSVWLKQVLDKRPEILQSITSPDGKIYNMPGINGVVEVRLLSPTWINKNWLKNLGMQAPTNVDEYYNMLKAFKEKDANGNGDPNDEIALGGWAGLQPGSLMGAFGVMGVVVDSKDGKVISSYDKPYYKEALQYINKLYTEGLLFNQCLTIDRASFAQINEKEGKGPDGILKIGSMSGPGHTFQFADPAKGTQLQYEGFLINGPNGRKYQQGVTHISYGISSNVVITSKCKEPEVAFRVLDWLYSEEGTRWTGLGGEGVAWKAAAPGAKGLDGRAASIERLTVGTDNKYYQNTSWTLAFGCNYDYDFNMTIAYPADPYANDPAAYEKYLYYNTHKYDGGGYIIPTLTNVPNMYYAAEDQRIMSFLQTQVFDYVNQSYAQFVNGTMNFTTDWDKYVTTLKSKAGLDLYIDALQRTYDKSAFKKK